MDDFKRKKACGHSKGEAKTQRLRKKARHKLKDDTRKCAQEESDK